eukprot:CAMPEP_0197910628 /NCGR_PEP_ID=MMETSP1439-20131203/71239_1 /TAXON_ID=66791 /ORGANISM="Gonyaulax spinifera, Strain CCMP409" /LENGTH=114 /DNA_ID=CAMNT_0043532305 /DNA_START=102 /DNA_END=442 /DNA_ORIENTATION=+
MPSRVTTPAGITLPVLTHRGSIPAVSSPLVADPSRKADWGVLVYKQPAPDHQGSAPCAPNEGRHTAGLVVGIGAANGQEATHCQVQVAAPGGAIAPRARKKTGPGLCLRGLEER